MLCNSGRCVLISLISILAAAAAAAAAANAVVSSVAFRRRRRRDKAIESMHSLIYIYIYGILP